MSKETENAAKDTIGRLKRDLEAAEQTAKDAQDRMAVISSRPNAAELTAETGGGSHAGRPQELPGIPSERLVERTPPRAFVGLKLGEKDPTDFAINPRVEAVGMQLGITTITLGGERLPTRPRRSCS